MACRIASSARLTVVAWLSVLLVGCVHSPSAPPPSTVAPAPGQAIFEEAVALPVVSSSIVREGDQVAYLVSRPASESRPETLIARFSASCVQPSGQMMYPTQNGMAYFTAVPRTLDDDSQLPAMQLQQLRDSSQLHQVCAESPRPDWRRVAGAVDRNWLLLDIASLRQAGSETLFWGAYDYPREQLDSQGRDAHVQRRERFAVDCQQQRFRRLSAFYIDADNQVGAGQVLLETPRHAVADATNDERLLLAHVCGAASGRITLAAFEPRIKAPASVPVPPVAAPVAEAVQKLGLGPAPRTIHRLGLSFDATVFQRQLASNASAQWFFSSDPATGQTVIQKRGLAAPGNIEVSFRGLVPLSTAFSDASGEGPKARVVALTYLHFAGDWQHMPVGQTLSYSRAYKPLVDGQPRLVDLITLYCSVDGVQPANALNPALQGEARQVTCKGENERATGVGHYAYLVDYGLFFPLRTVDRISDWAWRIETLD